MSVKKKLLLGVVIFSTVLTSFSFYVYQIFRTPNVLVDQEPKAFYIKPNATFDSIQGKVREDSIVQDLLSFSFVAKLLKYDRHIKPGRYELKPDMNNLEAIRQLRSGKQDPVKVTFNNVRTVEELSEALAKNLYVEDTTLLQLLKDTALVHELGFTRETVKCMFIPNTYFVYWTATPQELLDRMKHEYRQFWTAERKAKADSLGLSQVEVSILASIVQAEQLVHPDERPKIAGLYINRLERGYRLDSDPTLVYALGDFSIKRVLNKHKQIDSPYNTYKNYGLPPGPINVPAISSIDAVLNYEDHNYLYMCAKEDFSGYHNFAHTLREHNNNARRYQRALNKARIYR